MLFAKVCHRLACLKLESWIMTWNQRWRQAPWNKRCFSLLSYLFESHVIAVILVFNILFWQDGTALAWRYEVKPKMKVNAFMLQKPNASTNMENMKSSSICSVFFEECKKIPKTKYCKQLWEVGAWHVKKHPVKNPVLEGDDHRPCAGRIATNQAKAVPHMSIDHWREQRFQGELNKAALAMSNFDLN